MGHQPTGPGTSTIGAADSGTRVRLDIAYHGAGFHGFARNTGVRTVAGAICEAIAAVSGEEVDLVCAGRTDAGVHALGQVASCALPLGVDLEHLRRGVNAIIAPGAVIRTAERVPWDFDARTSARWRRYRYTLITEPDPFLDDRAWLVPGPLDVPSMSTAAACVLGVHDFAAFCRRPKGQEARPGLLTREILATDWTVDGDRSDFHLVGRAFCHNMVRSLVGSLVEVGRGRRPATWFAEVLEAGDRSRAGRVAPPHGLCLMEVGYGPARDGYRFDHRPAGGAQHA